MGSLFSSPAPDPPIRRATSYAYRPTTSSYSSRPATSSYSSGSTTSPYYSGSTTSPYSSRPTTSSYSSVYNDSPSRLSRVSDTSYSSTYTSTRVSPLTSHSHTSTTTRVSDPSYSYIDNSTYISTLSTRNSPLSSHSTSTSTRVYPTRTPTLTSASTSTYVARTTTTTTSPYASTSTPTRVYPTRTRTTTTSTSASTSTNVARTTSSYASASTPIRVSLPSTSTFPFTPVSEIVASSVRQPRNTSRTGGRICKYWTAGHCKKGDACRFLHPGSGSSSSATPSYKKPQPVCRFWQESRCDRGKACRFLHPVPDDPVVQNQKSRNAQNIGKGKGRMKASQSSTKECNICVNVLHTTKFTGLSAYCRHRANICRTCINEYIQHELDDKGNISIKCPESDCGAQIEHKDIERITTKEVFTRYDYIYLRQTLQKDPNFRWCKDPDCGSGQIHENPDTVTVMTCDKCQARSCFTHDLPIKVGSKCQACIDMGRTEAQTNEFMAQETKECPKCNARIIKDGGCDHMTCKAPGCQYEFCWMCFADYDQIRKNGNKYHKIGCKWWA